MGRKVGILTLTGKKYNNHAGAVLQAYALQKTLRRLGFPSELIDFTPKSLETKESLGKQLKKSIVTRGLVNTLLVGVSVMAGLKKREYYYHNFKTNHIQFTTESCDNPRHIIEVASNYDVFIVGSDTVWMPQLGIENLEVYLLKFAKDSNIKISYAASVWYPIPKSLCLLYKTLLERFDFISVREKTSREYLKQCGVERDIDMVLDPTLLLPQRDYKSISRIPDDFPDEPYIFYYDVHFSKGLFSKVISLAKKTGMTVVTETALPKGIKNKVYSFYSYGPSEFLGLIQNADLVITSSFHGTVFSVIFRKQFYSIKPDFAPPNKIFDFLESIGLQDRFITPYNLKEKVANDRHINWEPVEEKLEKKVNHSILFLKKALGGLKR